MPTLPIVVGSNFAKFIFGTSFLLALAACGGGGAKQADTSTPPPPTATSRVASIVLKPTPSTVKSDDSNTSSIEVTAQDSNGGVVSGATINFTTADGVLIPGVTLTDSQGKGTVEFSSGTTDISSRSVTITANANGISTQTQIKISGSTIDVTAPTTSVPDNGTSTATLTVLVKDAGGNAREGIAINLTQAGGGGVSFSPASGTTDSSGTFTTTIAGTRPGTVTVTISTIGEKRTQTYTVTPTSTNSFNIDQQTLTGTVIANNDLTAMTVADSLAIRVNAPGVSNVIFATAFGRFGASNTVTVPVVGGKATATFTSTKAGIATVQVIDPANPSTNTDSLSVAVTATPISAARISIQASPNIVGVSSGGTTSTSSLVATVTDAGGQPVGGAAVVFEIINGTGGGEFLSPSVQLTSTTAAPNLALGQAKVIFTSGSLPSPQGGVKIRASVVGASTAVETRDPINGGPCSLCGVDAAITIGGAPASIAIAQPSGFTDSEDQTLYIFPMSIFVSDASGKGVPGIPVSVSVFPIAWSTSIDAFSGRPYACGFDEDDAFNRGTFLNEDFDEDFILDGDDEDGVRQYYIGGAIVPNGTKNNKITAPAADGGVFDSSVVSTNANGIATVTLRYPKASAFHIIDRVRASTLVQGTETVGELQFRLPALKKDADTDCFLPPSPYLF